MNLKHLWQLFKVNFGISASVMFIYRLNLLFFLLFESLFLASYFITIDIGFDYAGGSIAGWTKTQGFLLASATGLSHQIFITFFVNPIFVLPRNIWNGQFDYVLLKPLKVLPALLSTSEMSVSNIPNLVINLGITIYFLSIQTSVFSFVNGFLFFVFLFAGVVVRVFLALAFIAPAFFAERLNGGEQSYWSLSSLANYPLSAFPRQLEWFFTLIIPIGMISFLPSQIFFNREYFPWAFLALCASLIFCILSWKFFWWSLKHYKSTNAAIG
jgi:ABC-2 type transport system permease protein